MPEAKQTNGEEQVSEELVRLQARGYRLIAAIQTLQQDLKDLNGQIARLLPPGPAAPLP